MLREALSNWPYIIQEESALSEEFLLHGHSGDM